ALDRPPEAVGQPRVGRPRHEEVPLRDRLPEEERVVVAPDHDQLGVPAPEAPDEVVRRPAAGAGDEHARGHAPSLRPPAPAGAARGGPGAGRGPWAPGAPAATAGAPRSRRRAAPA